MIKLYNNAEIRSIEQRCITEYNMTERTLMAAAAKATLQSIQHYWAHAKRVAIFCGKGNNAGDGFVLARLAHQAGLTVTVYMLVDITQLTTTAQWAANESEAVGVTLERWHDGSQIETDLIVDALLGTGLKGEVSAAYADVIDCINTSNTPVLALDVASGLDVDTGNCCGKTIKANITQTFIGLKQGQYTHKGPAYCGKLLLNDLNVPQKLMDQADYHCRLMEWNSLRTLLPKRRKDVHKGDCGHVLVIGGDYGMGGAVRLAAEAAARVGAGLVTVATRPEHVTIVSGARPEIMCHQVTCQEDLMPLLERASVVVIGPGLGKSEWARSLLTAVIDSKRPVVLDADGLNILSEAPFQQPQWVLTPHPGEAARLLGISSEEVQAERFHAITQLVAQYHGTCVLKGAGTLVKSQGEMVASVCPAGNPGMATGGMGDILSGIIAGFIAQKLSLADAAELGVLIHAIAADRAAEKGGERGLLATDLLDFLRELVNP